VDPANKAKLLVDLLKDNNMTRTLVFTRTKHGADKVMKNLSAAGYTAAAIHGNKSQNNRERALAGFKAGKILVLVATDIAARGIDVDAVSHVVNYDLPHVPESYVHRIGRTARAGADGSAIAFCTPEDRGLLRDIEKTIRAQVPVKEHELGLKGVSQLAPTFGWNPAGKDKPQGAKPHHRGQKPNRNHGAGGAPKQGSKPQGNAQPRRDAKPNSGGAQAPKRSGGDSWMTQLGNRQG
jgi:ATP-dependent RNA helicase RhlE